MLEFITMLSIVALIFCAATVFVALAAGGILKVSRALQNRTAEKITTE